MSENDYPPDRAADAMRVIAANLLAEGQTSRGRWCEAAADRIDALLAALRAVEWAVPGSEEDGSTNGCPCCFETKRRGHATFEGCALAAALALAAGAKDAGGR